MENVSNYLTVGYESIYNFSTASMDCLVVKPFNQLNRSCLQPSWVYLNRNNLIQMMPLSVITTVAFAYLFAPTTLAAGAVFGTVNFVSVKVLSHLFPLENVEETIKETIRDDDHTAMYRAGGIIALSYAVSAAFVKTVVQAPLTHPAALMLAVPAILLSSVDLSKKFKDECSWEACKDAVKDKYNQTLFNEDEEI